MRAVALYSTIFLPSRTISSSATRAHLIPRTVLAASATAFSAALAKLSLEAPTISITFCAIVFPSVSGRQVYRIDEGIRATKKGAGRARSRVPSLENFLRGLRSCSGSSDLIQNRHGLADLCNTKNHHRRIRPCLKPAVAVVDVNVRFAEPRRRSREFPPSVRQLGLC